MNERSQMHYIRRGIRYTSIKMKHPKERLILLSKKMERWFLLRLKAVIQGQLHYNRF